MLAAGARADPEPPVLLALDRCEELDQGEVRRIFAAELGVRPVNSSGPDVTEATVTCEGPRVIIRVRDPLSRKALQRSFTLALADPRARARLVSIAATELVLASWSELETNPKLHVEPEGPKPPAEATRAAQAIAEERRASYEPKSRRWYETETPDDRMLRVVALGSARRFFGYPGTLFGGGLRVGEERFRFMSWSADALFESGTLDTRESRYDVFTTTLGGWILLYGRAGPVTGRVGAGLRAGVAGASVGGASGTSSIAPWGWPLGASSVSFRLTSGLVLDLSGEAGYVLLPVPGAGQKSIEGGWFSGQIGLGVIPGGGP
jgi:hypothetical protein